eukprot:TRINITY_DN82310_c0_g1_i1.p1 TRINITY_DN82310_c0_g1~~TRINITY_DN82310_c0_g1_i1.p1  ORF type:complete len:171 (+),score=24.81 TRINITY_DN82310_c0_g1_i1:130-642(+)
MAMDSVLSQIMKESMIKEQRMFRVLKDKQLAAKKAAAEAAGEPDPTITVARSILQPKACSSQVAYLSQTMGLHQNPHSHDGKPRLDADPQKLLRFGVSADGQGRGAYLKLETRKGGPTERYGRAVSTAQEVGWTASAATKTYTSSPFARRPLIKNQFYRPMGVSFSTGAL